MSLFNVGDKIPMDSVDRLPGETVVIDPKGVPRIKSVDGRCHLWRDGNDTPYGEYEIVWIPPTASLIDKLAEGLFNASREYIAGQPDWPFNHDNAKWSYQHPKRKDLYREFVKWFMDNYNPENATHPSKLIDGEGDTWYHRGEGEYSLTLTSPDTCYKDRATISEYYGGLRDMIW